MQRKGHSYAPSLIPILTTASVHYHTAALQVSTAMVASAARLTSPAKPLTDSPPVSSHSRSSSAYSHVRLSRPTPSPSSYYNSCCCSLPSAFPSCLFQSPSYCNSCLSTAYPFAPTSQPALSIRPALSLPSPYVHCSSLFSTALPPTVPSAPLSAFPS